MGNNQGVNRLRILVLRGTFVCVFLFAALFAKAQDCSSNLDLAKSNYQSGKLYDIPGILQDCLKNGFNRQQLVEAYELLSITYLYIDEPELAEESYLNLLGADPEYRPDSAKQIEIEFLSKNFKTTPIFTLYPFKLGTNVTYARVMNVNGTDNTELTREKYKSLWGLHVGGGGDWHISQELSLGAELWFNFNQFRYTNLVYDNDSLQINEKQIGVEIPVFIRYTKRINRWNPFIFAGYSISYLINSSATPNYFEITESFDSLGNVENRIINPDFGRNLNLTKIRSSFNQNVVFGLGAKYRVEYQYLLVEVRYSLGLKNILNHDAQFDLGQGGEQNDLRELTFKYGQVDNDFRLDNLSINFGYVYPLYKPRKVQKKSFKGIFGNLFKKKEKTTY